MAKVAHASASAEGTAPDITPLSLPPQRGWARGFGRAARLLGAHHSRRFRLSQAALPRLLLRVVDLSILPFRRAGMGRHRALTAMPDLRGIR